MTNRMRFAVLGLALTMSACGGNSPGGPSPSATLSVAGADMVRINASATFVATRTPAGGGAVTWSSDNPAIASVEGTGRVTGRTSGRTTIVAQSGELRATAAVRVVPDYHGRWEGVTVANGCTADGDFAGACNDVLGGGLPLNVAATQNRDAITGTIDFDGANGPISTTMQADGRLVTTAQLTLVVEGIAFDVSLAEWDTVSVDNRRMTGRFRLEVRHALAAGSWILSGDLAEVQKTSGTPSAAAATRPGMESSGRTLSGRLGAIARRWK